RLVRDTTFGQEAGDELDLAFDRCKSRCIRKRHAAAEVPLTGRPDLHSVPGCPLANPAQLEASLRVRRHLVCAAVAPDLDPLNWPTRLLVADHAPYRTRRLRDIVEVDRINGLIEGASCTRVQRSRLNRGVHVAGQGAH